MFNQPVHSKKAHAQKWHVAYEHPLIVGVVNHRRRQQKQQGAAKGGPDREPPFYKPGIKQIYRGRKPDYADCHNVICHFHERQGIREQNQRAEQTIIREIVNVLSTPDIRGEIRKKIACLVKQLPEIIRKHTVLADPVNFGAKDTVFQDTCAAEYQNGRQQSAANDMLAPARGVIMLLHKDSLRFFCIRLLFHWILSK